jgi:hypothetical protein
VLAQQGAAELVLGGPGGQFQSGIDIFIAGLRRSRAQG